jgi:hypothetical protein
VFGRLLLTWIVSFVPENMEAQLLSSRHVTAMTGKIVLFLFIFLQLVLFNQLFFKATK